MTDIDTRPLKPANDPTDQRPQGGVGPHPAEDPNAYPADKARQGRIVLDTPLRKKIFIGGLVGLAVLVIIMAGISIGRAQSDQSAFRNFLAEDRMSFSSLSSLRARFL